MSYPANKNFLSSTGIAVLASLGIHGLLWAVLPGLTINSQTDKTPSQRTIGLVQLSPQEQSRLPQVSTPIDNTLPSFASQQTELPPLPPSPPYQTSVMPPVQLSPGSTPIYNNIPNQNSAAPPLVIQGVLPPPPTNTSFPPIPETSQSNSYPVPPVSPNSYPVPPVSQSQPFVLPKNNGLPNTPLTPDRTLPPDDNIATATPPPVQNPPQTPTNLNTPNSSVGANKLPDKGKQELLAMRDSMRNSFPLSAANTPNTRSMSRQEIATALRGQQNRSNQVTPNTRSMSRQEIATVLRGQQNRSNQITPPKSSMSNAQIAAALKRQNLNPSNERSLQPTIEQENLDKYAVAQAEVQKKYPGVGTKQVRRKLTSCDRTIDGDIAVVSVVVNPEGKRLSEPNLITKNGKPDIVRAQNYVRSYEFAKTGKTTNYNFRLEFDYVARKCTQAKPTPAPATNTPTPTPLPTITPRRLAPTPLPTTTPRRLTPTPLPTTTPRRLTPTPLPTTTNTPEPTPLPTRSIPELTPPPSPDSVTPTPEATTPQTAPSPSDSQRPKDMF